jgi:hypothetical protein
MGIYIDDLLVKSKEKEDLITNLEETFWNLKCYRIMLNLLKCIVSVEEASTQDAEPAKMHCQCRRSQVLRILGLSSRD